MDIQSLEMKIEEDVLAFLIQTKFKKDVERAEKNFYRTYEEEINETVSVDFNAWLIYDYKMEEGQSFIQKYLEDTRTSLTDQEKEFIINRKKSFLSLYELKEIRKDQGVLRDVFTKLDYIINLNQIKKINVGDLILSRIIEFSNEYKLVGGKLYIPSMFKITIEKNIFEEYERYKNTNKYGTWQKFLKENSILLQKYIGVIDNVMKQAQGEDEYNVWQSTYLINDHKKIEEVFLKDQRLKLDFKEDGLYYFKFLYDGLAAEIVLEKNKLELECTSEHDRIEIKKEIELILGDLVRHYKDEIIKIDDII